MNREMTLELGEFSRAAMEAQARRQGLDVATLLARSAQYYILERPSERLSARVPSFVHSDTAGEHGLPLGVTIELDDGHWHELRLGRGARGDLRRATIRARRPALPRRASSQAASLRGCSSRLKPGAERTRDQALAVSGPESRSRSATWSAFRPRW